MARRTKIHVGLEIGTSKTCMVVGEVKADSAVKILGIGETKSAGVRKGEIYDYSQARACLKDALTKAEDASDVEIGSVFLAVTGAHIQGVNNRGTFRLPDGEPVVDLRPRRGGPHHRPRSPHPAGSRLHPPDHPQLLARWPRTLDLAHRPVRQNRGGGFPCRARHRHPHPKQHQLVRDMPLEVDDIVFSPIATAQMALDREQRERGALVIDIGGGTTDYALYLGGVITASGCIPVGGDHITNDIHLVTGLPFSKAERLKITRRRRLGRSRCARSAPPNSPMTAASPRSRSTAPC